MTPQRFSICAALAVATMAFPAVAGAQIQAGPGQGDNVQDSISLGNLSPSPSVVGFDADTSNYTTQPDLREFSSCNGTPYGKTIWGIFRTPRTGRLDVTAAGFDATIRLAADAGDSIQDVRCTDRLAGRIESFPRDDLPTVKKGGIYYVQTGGAQQQDGSIPGGPLEVAVELLKPAVVNGADAGLAYKFGHGGIKVTSVRIDGPRGSVISVFCVPKRCGKPKSYRVSKQTVFNKPIAAPAMEKPAIKSVDWRAPKQKNVKDVPVYSAAKQVFRGRKIKNGRTLVVAVQAEDQIGQVFLWKVRKNAAGAKRIRCIEPNSSKIKKIGRCNGT